MPAWMAWTTSSGTESMPWASAAWLRAVAMTAASSPALRTVPHGHWMLWPTGSSFTCAILVGSDDWEVEGEPSGDVGGTAVRVHLTGGLRVEGPTGAFTGADLPGPQGRVALAVLVLERGPVSHDRLAELLWDGAPPAKWKGALAAVVSKVRACLTEVGLEGSTVLASDGGAYEVRLPGDAWVDMEDALRRLDRAEGSLRRGDQAAALPDATVASSVLCRSLLAGLWSDWIVYQRGRLEEARHRCSAVLARAWLERGDPGQAAIHAEAMVTIDPLREVGHRLLMEAEWARGDRAAALRALQRCETVLTEELGVDPSPETLTLAAAVRA